VWLAAFPVAPQGVKAQPNRASNWLKSPGNCGRSALMLTTQLVYISTVDQVAFTVFLLTVLINPRATQVMMKEVQVIVVTTTLSPNAMTNRIILKDPFSEINRILAVSVASHP